MENALTALDLLGNSAKSHKAIEEMISKILTKN
jgi:hypothetical protein